MAIASAHGAKREVEVKVQTDFERCSEVVDKLVARGLINEGYGDHFNKQAEIAEPRGNMDNWLGFIEEMGGLALRGKLHPHDIRRYSDISGVASEETIARGLEHVHRMLDLETMLQGFLVRLEWDNIRMPENQDEKSYILSIRTGQAGVRPIVNDSSDGRIEGEAILPLQERIGVLIRATYAEYLLTEIAQLGQS